MQPEDYCIGVHDPRITAAIVMETVEQHWSRSSPYIV